MTQWLEVEDGHEINLGDCAVEQVHVFELSAIRAVNAALAARRPLLVRGEPGTGKSQTALAAAKAMNRPFLSYVVDSRTAAQDLVWTFDAVARLAEAQLTGVLGRVPGHEMDEEKIKQRLDVRRFVTPGPLWWALDWKSAAEHVKTFGGSEPLCPENWNRAESPVVLIDEIDKADSDVPNGLLDVLGSGRFKPRGYDKPICVEGMSAPLILITTNEERSLPDAFLRRCLVLQIHLPQDGEELIKFLVRRGKAHFSGATEPVLRKAAEQTVKDRVSLKAKRLPAPGQAEFLDLVRALISLEKEESKQLSLLDDLAPYALNKHPKESSR